MSEDTQPADAQPATDKPQRARVIMIGTGHDYVDGDLKVLPLEQAERLVRLGHARRQGG